MSLPKRIDSIDAMRGLGILGITPIHTLLVFAKADVFSTSNTTWNPNLAFPYFFFIISGMCLAISIGRRRRNQNLREIYTHALFRYGGYILLSIIMTVAISVTVMHLFRDTIDLHQIYRNILRWSEPIRGIGLSCLVSFLPVFYMTTTELLVTSTLMFSLSSLILYNIHDPFLYGPLTPILITGMYSLIKTVPSILFGAAFGKIIIENLLQNPERNRSSPLVPSKTILTTGIIMVTMIELAFFLLTVRDSWQLCGVDVAGFTAIGNSTKGLLFIKIGGPYQISTAFSIGGFMILLGWFENLSSSGHTFKYISFIGRTGIQIFIAHFLLLILEALLLGTTMIAPALLLALILLNSSLMYVFAYFYDRQGLNAKIKMALGMK